MSEPRSQTEIFECSRANATAKYSNSDWINQFSEGIELKRGDTIRVLGSFVEETNSDTNIVIDNDYKANLEFMPYITPLSFGSSDNIEAQESGFQSTLGAIGAPALATDALGTEPPMGVRAPTLKELDYIGVDSAGKDKNTYGFSGRYDLGNYLQGATSCGQLFGGLYNQYGVDNSPEFNENKMPPSQGCVSTNGGGIMPGYGDSNNSAPVGTFSQSWQGKYNSYFGEPSCTRLVDSTYHSAGSSYKYRLYGPNNAANGESGTQTGVSSRGFWNYTWGYARNNCPFTSLQDRAQVLGTNIRTDGRGRGGTGARMFGDTHWNNEITEGADQRNDYVYSQPRKTTENDRAATVTASGYTFPVTRGLYRTTNDETAVGDGTNYIIRGNNGSDVLQPDEVAESLDTFNKLSIENQFYISTMCKLIYIPKLNGMSFNPTTTRNYNIMPSIAPIDGQWQEFDNSLFDGALGPDRIKAGNYLATYLISNKRGIYPVADQNSPQEEIDFPLGFINWKWGPQSVVGKILSVQKQYDGTYASDANERQDQTTAFIPMYKCYVTEWMTPASYKSQNKRVTCNFRTIPSITPQGSQNPSPGVVRGERHGGGDLPNGYNTSALFNKVNGYPLSDLTNPYYSTMNTTEQEQDISRQPSNSTHNFYKGTPTEAEAYPNRVQGLGIGVDNGVNFLWSGRGNPTNICLEQGAGSWQAQRGLNRDPTDPSDWDFDDGLSIDGLISPDEGQFYNHRLYSPTQTKIYWELNEWTISMKESYSPSRTDRVASYSSGTTVQNGPKGVDRTGHYDVGAIVCLTEEMLADDDKEWTTIPADISGKVDNFYVTYTNQSSTEGRAGTAEKPTSVDNPNIAPGVSPFLTRNFSQMGENEVDGVMVEDVGYHLNQGLLTSSTGRTVILDAELSGNNYGFVRDNYAKDRNWLSTSNTGESASIICSPPMYNWSRYKVGYKAEFGTDLPTKPQFIINDTPMAYSQYGQTSKWYKTLNFFSDQPFVGSPNNWTEDTSEMEGKSYFSHPTHYNQSNLSIYFQSPGNGCQMTKLDRENKTQLVGAGVGVLQNDLYSCDMLVMQTTIAEITIPAGKYNATSLSETINDQIHYTTRDSKINNPDSATNVGTGGVKNTPGSRNNIVNGNFVHSYVPDLSYGFTPIEDTPELNRDISAPTTTDVTTLLYTWDSLNETGQDIFNDTDPANGVQVSNTFRGKIYTVPVQTEEEQNLDNPQLSLFRLKGGALANNSYPTKTLPVPVLGGNGAGWIQPGSGRTSSPFQQVLPKLGGGQYPPDATYSYDDGEGRRHGVLDILSVNGGRTVASTQSDRVYSPSYPTVFPYYSRTAMNKLSYGGSAKIFVGANNPTFQYDPGLNKNFWSNLYVPFRPNSSQNPNDTDDTTFGLGDAVPSAIIDGNGNGAIQAQYGGMYLYSLTGKPYTQDDFSYNSVSGLVTQQLDSQIVAQGEALWGLLGFNQTQIDKYQENLPVGNTKPYIHITEDITYGNTPIRNAPIVDISANASNPFRGNLTLTAGLPQFLVQAESDRIIGGEEGLRYSEPYYHIGSDLPIESVYGSTTGTKLPVVGICARNFERENFVFDIGASSINAIVKEDTTITSIHTKIYTAGMKEPKSIGSQSSIVYEIIRNNVDLGLEGGEASLAAEILINDATPIPANELDFGNNPPNQWRYGMDGLVPPTEINTPELMQAWLLEPASEPLIQIGEDESDVSDYE